MPEEDPYGTWCAIASDLGRAINIFKEMGLDDESIRAGLIKLVDKCLESK